MPWRLRKAHSDPHLGLGRDPRTVSGRRIIVTVTDTGGRLAYSDDEEVRTSSQLVEAIRALPPGGKFRAEVFLLDPRSRLAVEAGLAVPGATLPTPAQQLAKLRHVAQPDDKAAE